MAVNLQKKERIVKKLILGTFLNPLNDKKCELFKEGAMVIKSKKVKGLETFVVDALGPIKKISAKYKEYDEVIDLRGKVIMPGFFDMHFHWVQDDVREMPKDNLLTWLDKYTFPAERKFENKEYAKKKAEFFFNRLLKTGTVGGACYSSIHEHAVNYAFKYAKGDFVIGNVLMTINSPDFLTQTKSKALKLATKLSEKYKERYALTPRFAIATDPETMKETAKIAKKNKSFLQTHLSETPNEIEFVKSIYKNIKGFEKVKSYTEIYKKVGMLSSKTIMGHGIHLDPQELELLSKSKTSIAHCPTSNAQIKELGLGSGLFDFKRVEKANIRWALASDIGGGPYVSMFDVMRSFVDQNQRKKVKGATHVKALYRSTLAGAEILKLGKTRGNLEKGKIANFIAVDMPKGLKGTDKAEDILKKIVATHKKERHLYDDLVRQVFFHGERVD
jgi:guanine deaminase